MTESSATREATRAFRGVALAGIAFLLLFVAGYSSNLVLQFVLAATGVCLLFGQLPLLGGHVIAGDREADPFAFADDPRRTPCALCDFPAVPEDSDYCRFCGWSTERQPSDADRARFASSNLARGRGTARLRELYHSVAEAALHHAWDYWVRIFSEEAALETRRRKRRRR
jgi:hypothetical protein